MVIASTILHGLFAWHQGFTNDEGAYLYDARTILSGLLPSGDVLTKAPVPIFFFAIGEVFSWKSLFAARIINSIFSIATVLPLFFLLRTLDGRKAAYIGSVLWLLGSGTIVFNSMGHTQTIAGFFAVSSLCLFVLGLDSTSRPGMTKLFFAGMCFALAYASRKTAVVVGVPIILSWFMLRDSRKGLAKATGVFLLGVVSAGIPWMLGVLALYGFQGVWHMLGGAYGEILVYSQSISPWAGSAQHMLFEAVRIGSLYGLLLLVVCFTIFRSRVLVGASWAATLGIAYVVWPTHLVEYLADFIPAIVLAGSLAIASLRLVRWQQYILGGSLLFLSMLSLRSVYAHPWTGMFSRDALLQSAQWLTEHVPMQEEVFTAAVIVPYVSGHNVLFHLSHPQWYGYDFISEQDKNTFLPRYSLVKEAVQTRISWVLTDQLTRYAYPDISMQAFHEVMRIPNTTKFRNNPLQVYEVWVQSMDR